MSATVIAEGIGLERGLMVLKDRVRGAAPGLSAAGRLTGRASWRSATSGSRRSRSRRGTGRSADRRAHLTHSRSASDLMVSYIDPALSC